MKKLFIACLSVAALTTMSFVSKSPVFEGKIVYSISYEDLPEEYASYMSMLPKESTMYVKGEKFRLEQSAGMGTTVTIIDNKAKTGYICMDMMGNKMAFKMDAKTFENNTADENKPEVKYTDETKTIAGYTCKKAEIMSKDAEEPMVIWFTDELPAFNNKDFKYINGFPMEYQVKNGGITMLMTVTTVSKEKVSDSYFKVPEGYTEKTMQDMESMFGTGGK
jgi:hypothetical protein